MARVIRSGSIRIDSRIESKGTVKSCLPTQTIMPSMMASVRGILIAKQGPLAGTTGDVDSALDSFDVTLDNIHADATARDIGEDRGRGKTGLEEQGKDFGITLDLLIVGDQAHLDRFRAYFLPLDAATIVSNLDDDLATLVKGAEVDGSGFGFTELLALVDRLDAVVDCVANGCARAGSRVIRRQTCRSPYPRLP